MQELGLEAQKHLEEMIQAAHQILLSMNDELCNPTFWCTATPSNSRPVSEASSDEGGMCGGGKIIDEARLRYKPAVSSLRSVLASIATSLKKGGLESSNSEQNDEDEIERMEKHASILRKELIEKNKQQKLLIDQFRTLIAIVTLWQSPCSL